MNPYPHQNPLVGLHGAYPQRAGYKAPGTSQDTANAIEGSGRAARLRNECLRFYAQHEGTADDCAEWLHESPFSIRPRVSELLTRKKLEKTGARKKGCAVLRLAPETTEQAA